MDAFNAGGAPFERAPSINLASPPRAVPLNVRLRVILGGLFSLIGWAVALSGLIFVAIFLSSIDLDASRFRPGSFGVAAGSVTLVERTSGRSGGRFIYANHYEFTLPGYEQDRADSAHPTGAEIYYRAAAAAGHMGATIRMGLIYEARGETTAALHTFAQAAARAHPGALDHFERLNLRLAREQAQQRTDGPPPSS